MVSKASDDFPEPETPVNTTRRSRGITRSTFLRLCSRAPRTAITRASLPPAPARSNISSMVAMVCPLFLVSGTGRDSGCKVLRREWEMQNRRSSTPQTRTKWVRGSTSPCYCGRGMGLEDLAHEEAHMPVREPAELPEHRVAVALVEGPRLVVVGVEPHAAAAAHLRLGLGQPEEPGAQPFAAPLRTDPEEVEIEHAASRFADQAAFENAVYAREDPEGTTVIRPEHGLVQRTEALQEDVGRLARRFIGGLEGKRVDAQQKAPRQSSRSLDQAGAPRKERAVDDGESPLARGLEQI